MIESMAALEFINLINSNIGKRIRFRYDDEFTKVEGTIFERVGNVGDWSNHLDLDNLEYIKGGQKYHRERSGILFENSHIFTNIEFIGDFKPIPISFKQRASKFF